MSFGKKRKGGPVKKENKKEIINKLKTLIETGQINGYSQERLANEFSTSRQTISQYLEEIYKDIPEEDIEKIYVNLKKVYERIFREAYNLLKQDGSKEDKRKDLTLLMNVIEKKTRTLEDFFKKQKASEYVQVQGEIDNRIEVEIVHTKRLVDDSKTIEVEVKK